LDAQAQRHKHQESENERLLHMLSRQEEEYKREIEQARSHQTALSPIGQSFVSLRNRNSSEKKRDSPSEMAAGGETTYVHKQTTSPETRRLKERCYKLEAYCKDLIKTNKVLDIENRLAIAQIVNIADPKQLNHLASAVNIVANSGKAYDKRKIIKPSSSPFRTINAEARPLAAKSTKNLSSARPSALNRSSHLIGSGGKRGNVVRPRAYEIPIRYRNPPAEFKPMSQLLREHSTVNSRESIPVKAPFVPKDQEVILVEKA